MVEAEKLQKLTQFWLAKLGTEHQVRKLMEECGELIQAANKYIDAGCPAFFEAKGKEQFAAINTLCEEVADVEILLQTLRTARCIDEDLVTRWKAIKYNRAMKARKDCGEGE